MLVKDLMINRVAYVTENESLYRAAELLSLTGLNDLVVIKDGKMTGTLSDGDILRALMPDMDELQGSDVSYLDLNSYFIQSVNLRRNKSIQPYIIRNPIYLHPQDTLFKATTVMLTKGIIRLPVLEHGVCVGMIGRSDINWGLHMPFPSAGS